MLGEAVVHEKGTGAAVDVGPRVADLAGGTKDLGDLFIVGLDELDKVVVVNVLVRELELAHEARIGLTQDSMAVPRYNLAGLERDINELTDVLTGPVLTVLSLEVQEVVKALLVSETVEGTG